MRKPFYRKALKCWYVKGPAGEFIRLDPDQEKAEGLWHELISSSCDRGRFATVHGVVESFLREHEPLMSRAAFYSVANYVLAFASSVPAQFLAAEVTKGQVTTWIRADKPGRIRKNKDPLSKEVIRGPSRPWSVYGQRDAGSAIKRVFKWARDEGMIERNPLAGLKLETPTPRDAVVTPEVHRQLVQECLASEKSRSFAVYLIASHCGARPQQIREVTAANVVGGVLWIFEHHKTRAKTGKPLRVYLAPCLQTLTRILAASRPSGPLFLNDAGGPWKRDTVCQRIRRLRDKLGLPESLIAYAYRHTYATDALIAGVDASTVAALLGHTSTAMVSRVYSHLERHQEHLARAAAKAASGRLASDSGAGKP